MKPNPTDFLVTPDVNKPSTWKYPIRHDLIAEMGRMSDVGYHVLHDGDNLLSAVGGRVVGLMLHGASIAEFEQRIEEFADLDMCYMSINRFGVMEEMLGRIGKQLSVVFLASEQEMPRRVDDLMAYLDRQSTLLMTTFSALSWLTREQYRHIVTEHDRQLYLMPRWLCRPHYPISLALILEQFMACGVRDVILFGVDGYVAENKGDEWDQDKLASSYYAADGMVNRASGIGFGTRHFNETFQWDDKVLRVTNCSEHSHINHFPRIGYDGLREAYNAYVSGRVGR